MGVLHGKAGKVVWNAEDAGSDIDITHVQSWNLDVVGNTADTTAMGDSWMTALGGFKEWTATVECNTDGAPQVPYEQSFDVISIDGLADAFEIDVAGDPTTQKVFIELWFTQTGTDGVLFGPAIATAISHAQDKEDVGKLTYSFKSNGEMFFKAGEPTDFVEPLS